MGKVVSQEHRIAERKLREMVQKEFGAVERPKFAFPLTLSVGHAMSRNERRWGYKEVVLKDKFGKLVKRSVVADSLLTTEILKMYARGIKMEKDHGTAK